MKLRYKNNRLVARRAMTLTSNGMSKDSTPSPLRTKTKVCVKGDRHAMIWPMSGKFPIGMKTPLMNSSGILTKLSGIMMLPTDSVGTEANMIPMAAKARHERTTPRASAMAFMTSAEKTKIPIMRGTTDTKKPKKIPAIVFPRSTEKRDIGADKYLSNVFVLLSRGMTTGPTVDEAQKTVCESRMGSDCTELRFLPTVKVKKRAIGNKTPNISDGGVR